MLLIIKNLSVMYDKDFLSSHQLILAEASEDVDQPTGLTWFLHTKEIGFIGYYQVKPNTVLITTPIPITHLAYVFEVCESVRREFLLATVAGT